MPVRKYAAEGRPPRFIATIDSSASGLRLRSQRSFRTEREARQWLDATRGRVAPSGSPTVGAVLDAWIAHGEAVLEWSPAHLERSRRVATRDLAPLRLLRVDRLRVAHVEQLFAGMRKQGLSPNSIKLTRNALSGAIRLAMRRGYLSPGENVARQAAGPEVRRRNPRFISAKDMPAFLDAIDGDRLATLYQVSMALALRPGEALGLRWEDIEFDVGVVNVRQNVQRVAGVTHVRPPKAGSARAIPIPAEVVQLLREQRVRQLRDEAASKRWERSGLVFTNPHGGPQDEVYANKRLRLLMTRAGLDPVTFYQLRHTGATLMRVLGVPLERIREVMGHSSITTTTLYAQLAEELEREPADRMGAFLRSLQG